MRRRRKKNNFTVLYLVVFILAVGIFGKSFSKLNLFNKDASYAVTIGSGLKMIGDKDPLRKEINKLIREEKFKKEEIARKKKEEEAKKKEEAKAANDKKNGKKIAYLTFDDGPSVKSTPMILDVLKKHNIKATFFVVGNMVEQNPKILKRVYDEGHQIGNHSYSHNYGNLYKNSKNFMDEIYKTEKLIKAAVGNDFDSKVIRFPGGSFEKKKAPMRQAAIDAGYKYIDWNALNGDAEGGTYGEAHLLNELKATVRGKRKAVILMHDTDQKITTARSLDASIKFLLDEGYEFRILDKNFSWE